MMKTMSSQKHNLETVALAKCYRLLLQKARERREQMTAMYEASLEDNLNKVSETQNEQE